MPLERLYRDSRCGSLMLPWTAEIFAAFSTVPPQQQRSRRRRAGPRVEHRDVHLSAGERLRDQRQVTDHQGQKRESQTGLQHGERPGERRPRGHVAQSQREEGRAAHVDVFAEPRAAARARKLRRETPVKKAERNDQAERPKREEQDERERTEYREEVFARVARRHSLRGGSPRRPQDSVEVSCDAELPRDPARENDGLERVPENDEDQSDADDRGPGVHDE